MKQFGVPVLLIFFTRPQVFQKVFECVKKVKPTKLYLYQDGPRNEKDIEGIEACRNIASQIDWPCEVHKFYQEKNVGCDPSEYIAQKWMFASEDRGIVIEDDDVVSTSFFYFCEELLERYKDDQRINMICGLNILGKYHDTEADYFFARSGAITGWASWKRVIDEWDPNYEWMQSPYIVQCMKDTLGDRADKTMLAWKKQLATGKEHYEGILGSNTYLQHRLNIVPTKNMVANIGVTANATHSVASVFQLPRKIRRIFYKEIYEYDFPLRHPKYVIEDYEYTRRIWDNRKFMNLLRRIEGRIYMLFPFLGQLCSDDLKARVKKYTE